MLLYFHLKVTDEKTCSLQNGQEMALSSQTKFSLQREICYQQTMQNNENVFLHLPLLTLSLSLLLSFPLCLTAFVVNVCEFWESLCEVKKSGDDLCRYMHRNSSRPYDVVFLLKNMRNMSQGEQSEWECVCVPTYVLITYSCSVYTYGDSQSGCVALLYFN